MNIYTSLKLDTEPFSISPNPDFFYRSIEHASTLNKLEIAIRLKKGLCVVLGDVGTGKTTLSRALFQAFEEDYDYIFHMLLDPYFGSENEFLTHLAKLFGVAPFFRSSIDFRDAIEKYLYDQTVEQGKSVVLVIDEGQKLSQLQLEVLRTLLNYETNDYKLIQIVILGQMELLPRMKRMRNFKDRVNFFNILNALDFYDTEQLIEFRMRHAGYKGKESLFTQEAIRMIYGHTKGYPRQISRICQNALEEVITEGYDFVNERVVAKLIAQEEIWGIDE